MITCEFYLNSDRKVDDISITCITVNTHIDRLASIAPCILNKIPYSQMEFPNYYEVKLSEDTEEGFFVGYKISELRCCSRYI